MPLHDYQCEYCDHIHEEFVEWDEMVKSCPECGSGSHRVYLTFNGIKHEAPTWLADTLEVVDKEGGRHCQEFLKHPNRSNYNNWMKGEGLRPMEEGESTKRSKKDTSSIRKKVKESFRSKNSITIRG